MFGRDERGEIGRQSVLTRGDYLDGAWEAQRCELPTRAALAEVERAEGGLTATTKGDLVTHILYRIT